MLKPLHLTTILSATSILCIAEAAFSLPLTVTSWYRVVPSSDTDQLACYMQTEDGRTLNLNNLCNSRRKPQPQVAIGNIFYNGNYIIGKVINQTNKTVRNVQVNYEVLDKNGSVIEGGSVGTEPQTLNPGQIATFEAAAVESGNARATSVNWDE